MVHRLSVWAAAAATALVLISGCARRNDDRPSAIVLITVDTLRGDAVSFDGGSTQRTTPFLDTLAEDAVVFSRAYAPSSWTAPSMASLLTALWPQSHGIRRGDVQGDAVVRQSVLDPSIVTLPERLSASGFTTVGVAANLHLAAHLGFAQGFKAYARAGFMDAAEVNVAALKQINAAFGGKAKERWRVDPAFLWLHYFDPHMPYDARKPWIDTYAPGYAQHPEKFPSGFDAPRLFKEFGGSGPDGWEKLRALYLSEVSYVDEQLRQLNMTLHFDDPNVLLIVTADHGEEFGDHRGLGHATTVYDECVRVPLFIRWPARLPAARRSDPVSLVDIYPTVLALLGEVSETQGRPLFGSSAKQDDERPLVVQTDRAYSPLSGLVVGSWKGFWSTPKKGDPQFRLFDLANDPREQTDQSATRPEIVAQFETLRRDFIGRLPPPPSVRSAELGDSSTSERLRALGYE